MQFQTIYIIRPIQIFVSNTDMVNGYTRQHYHGERELAPRVALSLQEERKIVSELKREYELKGLEVVFERKQFRTGKKTYIEAIEKYKTEKGV